MPVRQREPRLMSKKITQDAKEQSCQNCGRNDGTTVNAHCNDIEFRGMGMKASDFMTCWLCGACHDLCDGRAGKLSKEEKRALWDRAFKRTVAQRFRQGLWRTA